jgi:hypothetical protein
VATRIQAEAGAIDINPALSFVTAKEASYVHMIIQGSRMALDEDDSSIEGS